MATPPLQSTVDRRRRRRRRLIPVIGYVIIALVLAYLLQLRQSTTIIFVRHADTDVAMATDDPPLNEQGRQRAEMLADFLQDVDVVAGVDAIYVSDKRRTQETAAPLAERLNLKVTVADQTETARFIRRVLRNHRGEIVLVVSHSNLIAPLIDELHGSKRLPPIEHDDYDEVYIVTTPAYGKVKTLRLHYAQRVFEPHVSDASPAPLIGTSAVDH
jgi:broad specificity phosphatase PhoE